jgi:hypothetical protein
MGLYKTVGALIAIPVDDDDSRLFIEIPPGTLVRVETLDTSGLVQFRYAGQSYATFRRDLECHAELVKTAA